MRENKKKGFQVNKICVWVRAGTMGIRSLTRGFEMQFGVLCFSRETRALWPRAIFGSLSLCLLFKLLIDFPTLKIKFIFLYICIYVLFLE